jgi:hypothetical protein
VQEVVKLAATLCVGLVARLPWVEVGQEQHAITSDLARKTSDWNLSTSKEFTKAVIRTLAGPGKPTKRPQSKSKKNKSGDRNGSKKRAKQS